VVAHPDERHAIKTASVLEWYDRPEHSTTSVSNEEEANIKQNRKSECEVLS